ncbi:MAG TPA: acyl-CoA reductase [Nitrospinota bacterium]|nr:acyl-CoA reductase [Nitrospinota bacterium]
MPIFNIPIKETIYLSWDLNEAHLAGQEVIDDYEAFVKQLSLQSQSLRDINVNDLLSFFDSLATCWMSSNGSFLRKYSRVGVTFLLNFIRKANLQRLLNTSLRGNISYLDNFHEAPELGKKIMAHPRGIVTHWLAGNVPVLGMISLITAMLSKNGNIIKLPRKNGLVLPSMVADFKEHKIQTADGKVLEGRQLVDSIKFIYCEKDDLVSQRLLSCNSDVRVAWGGREVIETILSLPKHYGIEDVIFGPKYSFALISRNSFNKSELDSIAYRLALDASIFEQQGCNSPHTVFVEERSEISPLDFAKALARGMEKVLKTIPKEEVSADEAYSIVNIRSEYSFSGEVFSSKGTEWTVIYSQEQGLAHPSYSRVLFVRPIKDIYDIIDFVDKHKQTLGLLIDQTRKIDFAKAITAKGIERITEFGKMSFFDYPWDGMFPIDRFVRWVSLS